MDTLPKQEFKVRDLDTKSVTLFPSRAQIVREIKDLQLAPGTNEITVVGLTPTVDEESIKVEGSGSAIITDIAIELLPNRDIFEEIYPPSDPSDDESNDFTSDSEDDHIPAALQTARATLNYALDSVARANEKIANAENRLRILDAHGKTLDRKRNVDIGEGLETYRAEREKVFSDKEAGLATKRDLEKQVETLRKAEGRLARAHARERAKVDKVHEKRRLVRQKAREARERRRAQRHTEKQRVLKERQNFWPKYCYSVTITLDVSAYTPMSSRRGSVASEADLLAVKETKATEADSAAGGESSSSGCRCDLLISYVTSSAFWSPSYDLQLSTTSNTGALSFEAQLTNATSETWSNTKVVLSTSQTNFSGLQDALPSIVPWNIGLAGKYMGVLANDVVDSREEREEQAAWAVLQRKNVAVQKPRAHLFGVSQPHEVYQSEEEVRRHVNEILEQQASEMEKKARGEYNSLNKAPSAKVLNRASAAVVSSMVKSSRPSVKKGSMAPGPSMFRSNTRGRRGAMNEEFTEEEMEGNEPPEADGGADDETILEAVPEVDFQDSAMEETGLTTTYDLPGLKTLPPRSRATRQRIARMGFANVVYNHTIVAKYKPAAYLKAKLHNASKLTLLRGPAGLTLDGSFLGRTRIPRCSPSDSFLLSLGIDPAVRVTYPKPEVRRSTSGFLSKEDSSVYRRVVSIVNTKAQAGSKPASIFVLDQVPLSQDERLRVALLHPRGLAVGGGVATGVPLRETDADWGRATASLKKVGELTWDVSLKPGKGVKLVLEYEVAAPAGEFILQC